MRLVGFLIACLLVCAATAADAVDHRKLAAVLSDNSILKPVPIPPAPPPSPAFSNSFLTTCLPTGLTYTRTGNAFDYNSGGTITTFSANNPACQSYYHGSGTNTGFGIWGTRINQLLNSAAPVTQTRTLATAGTYVLSVKGTGSLAPTAAGNLTLLSCVSNTASDGVPCVFQTTATNVAVTFTVIGSLSFIQVEFVSVGSVPQSAPSAPIVTVGASVTRSAETLNGTFSSISASASSGAFITTVFIPFFTNTDQTIMALSDGSGLRNGVRVWIRTTDHKLQIACETNGVQTVTVATSNAVAANASHTVGFNYDVASGFSLSVDGGTPANVAGPCAFTLNTYHPGNSGDATRPLQGYMTSFQAFTSTLSSIYLQAYTAPPDSRLSGNVEFVLWGGQSLNTGALAVPVVTTAAINSQSLMPNNSRGIGGMRVSATYSLYPSSSISGVLPAVEAPSVYPPSLPTSYGETGIAYDMGQLVTSGNTSNLIGVSFAGAGKTIAQLTTGQPAFENMISYVGILGTLTKVNGGTPVVNYLRWAQGESDRSAGTPATAWRSTATTMSNDATNRIKAITGQSAAPVWLVMQMPADGLADGTGSPISQAQFDQTIPLNGVNNSVWHMCGSDYPYGTHTSDGTHKTLAEFQRRGEQYALCAAREAAGSANINATRPSIAPAFATGDATKINVTITVNSTAITIDDGSALLQGPAYKHGFQFVDDCILASPSAPYTMIDTVTKTAAKTVQIVLTGTGWSNLCANPHLRHAYDGPALAHMSTLPVVSAAGTGGTPGACVISLAWNTSHADAQAQYNATIDGSGHLASISSQATGGWGLYPQSDAYITQPQSGVAVTGCGLTGATVNSVYLSQRFTSPFAPAAWGDIRGDKTTSRSGNTLADWMLTFDLAVTPP